MHMTCFLLVLHFREKKISAARFFFQKERNILSLAAERERIDQMTTGLENIQRSASAS